MGNPQLEIIAVDIISTSDRIAGATPTDADATPSDCNSAKDHHDEGGVSDHIYPADSAHSEKQCGDPLHPAA